MDDITLSSFDLLLGYPQGRKNDAEEMTDNVDGSSRRHIVGSCAVLVLSEVVSCSSVQ